MKYLLLLVAATACLQILGCAEPSGSGAKAEPTHVILNDVECTAFSRELTDAYVSGDLGKLNELIDWDSIFERAVKEIKGLKVPASTKQKITNDVSQGWNRKITCMVANDGSYRLLRLHDIPREKRALFRCLTKGRAVSYHDYILAKQPANAVRAIDIYVFHTDEYLSQMIRTRILATAEQLELEALPSQSSGAGKKPPGYVESVKALDEAMDHDRNVEALKIYFELPFSAQKQRHLMIARIIAASSISGKEYLNAIEAFQKDFPRDYAIDHLSLDGYLLDERFPQALACLNRLERTVGGDPYLDVIRAKIYLMQGTVDKAEQFAKQAVANAPDLIEAYDMLVTIAKQKQSTMSEPGIR